MTAHRFGQFTWQIDVVNPDQAETLGDMIQTFCTERLPDLLETLCAGDGHDTLSCEIDTLTLDLGVVSQGDFLLRTETALQEELQLSLLRQIYQEPGAPDPSLRSSTPQHLRALRHFLQTGQSHWSGEGASLDELLIQAIETEAQTGSDALVRMIADVCRHRSLRKRLLWQTSSGVLLRLMQMMGEHPRSGPQRFPGSANDSVTYKYDNNILGLDVNAPDQTRPRSFKSVLSALKSFGSFSPTGAETAQWTDAPEDAGRIATAPAQDRPTALPLVGDQVPDPMIPSSQLVIFQALISGQLTGEEIVTLAGTDMGPWFCTLLEHMPDAVLAALKSQQTPQNTAKRLSTHFPPDALLQIVPMALPAMGGFAVSLCIGSAHLTDREREILVEFTVQTALEQMSSGGSAHQAADVWLGQAIDRIAAVSGTKSNGIRKRLGDSVQTIWSTRAETRPRLTPILDMLGLDEPTLHMDQPDPSALDAAIQTQEDQFNLEFALRFGGYDRGHPGICSALNHQLRACLHTPALVIKRLITLAARDSIVRHRLSDCVFNIKDLKEVIHLLDKGGSQAELSRRTILGSLDSNSAPRQNGSRRSKGTSDGDNRHSSWLQEDDGHQYPQGFTPKEQHPESETSGNKSDISQQIIDDTLSELSAMHRISKEDVLKQIPSADHQDLSRDNQPGTSQAGHAAPIAPSHIMREATLKALTKLGEALDLDARPKLAQGNADETAETANSDSSHNFSRLSISSQRKKTSSDTHHPANLELPDRHTAHWKKMQEPASSGALSSLRSNSVPSTPTVSHPLSPTTGAPNPTMAIAPTHTDPAPPDLTQDRVIVPTSGLVLLWPFLTRFLTQVGALQEGRFLSPHAQRRSVHLLHWLATGETEAAEFRLSLPKLLVGLPLETPLRTAINLTPAEEEMGGSLLAAVRENWPALSAGDDTTLRETFLCRAGVLNRPDAQAALALQVERGPYDVLLKQLPWAFSVVRLTWMSEPLFVQWETTI